MPFISYGQNLEDVMLHRALGGIENGFYIDVGANLPEAESVTKAFYDRGWSGVNVEPTARPHALLERARQRDVNLHLACWRESGEQVLYLVRETEAFATLDPEMARLHREAGREVNEVSVVTTTLGAICREYVGTRDIHFLKVDVEGEELSVLQGADFGRWRPWIVLGEAHGPDFSVNLYQPWEDLLLGADYDFAYDDGLNRFYVARERREALMPAFVAPPNVYDGWIRASEVAASARAERVRELEMRASAEAATACDLAERLDAANRELRAVCETTTWRAHDRILPILRAVRRAIPRRR